MSITKTVHITIHNNKKSRADIHCILLTIMDLYSVYLRTVDGKLYKVLVDSLGTFNDLDLLQ